MTNPTHRALVAGCEPPEGQTRRGFEPRVGGAISRSVAPLRLEGRQPTEWGSESPHSLWTDEATDSPDAPLLVPTASPSPAGPATERAPGKRRESRSYHLVPTYPAPFLDGPACHGAPSSGVTDMNCTYCRRCQEHCDCNETCFEAGATFTYDGPTKCGGCRDNPDYAKIP